MRGLPTDEPQISNETIVEMIFEHKTWDTLQS